MDQAWKYERKANDDALQILTPLIPKLTAPPAVITSIDLGGMISNNSALAYLAVVGLLSNAPTSSPPSIPPNGQGNPNENGNGIPLLSYLEVLRHLPPTLPSFDLFGRLLKDRTVVPDITIQQPSGLPVGGGNTTIADLVRLEVLGWFIHSCVDWLDRWDEEERSGGRFDGGFGIGVRNVSVIYFLGFLFSFSRTGVLCSSSCALYGWKLIVTVFSFYHAVIMSSLKYGTLRWCFTVECGDGAFWSGDFSATIKLTLWMGREI